MTDPVASPPPIGRSQLVLSLDRVVLAVAFSDILQADAVFVPDDIYLAAHGRIGHCRYVGGALVDHAPAPLPVDLMAYAARVHVARRDGGVTIAGTLVKTDGESRGLIGGASALVELRPDARIDFKAASGWVSLDAASMQMIAVSVGLWVQACYSAYRAVCEAIQAGKITTPAQIDAAFSAVTIST